MKVSDRHTGFELEGEWAHVDDHGEYGECPTCGSAPGQQCSALDEDGEGVEVGAYVHIERADEAPEPTAQGLIERFGPCDHPNADVTHGGVWRCGHCSAVLPVGANGRPL